MTLTRNFRETVEKRVQQDPMFRKALLEEGVECLLNGEIETAKLVLRDYINATIGFEELGRLTKKSPKSLMRMFGASGNPYTTNLFEVVGYLQECEGCQLKIYGVREEAEKFQVSPNYASEVSSSGEILKSSGTTDSEKLLANLCEDTFLKLWSYPNPVKDDGKELCDQIVIVENHIFIFFDRESRKFDDASKDLGVRWRRWKREVIDKQISTVKGAERYIRMGRNVYLDNKLTIKCPIELRAESRITKIIVAHGAEEACKDFSQENIGGSLAICYAEQKQNLDMPFSVELGNEDIIHILDSRNLPIVFKTLDTIYDFSTYIIEKETKAKSLMMLAYCGEEDLVAHYLSNYNEKEKEYQIGPHDQECDTVFLAEGVWDKFSKSDQYKRWISANEVSYLWDELIQKTIDHVFDGSIGGNIDLFRDKNPILEMAKEPRFSRRMISKRVIESIRNFPIDRENVTRHIAFIPSFYQGVGYVFLQVYFPDRKAYGSEYRKMRTSMLEIACGAAKIKYPYLKEVIGIAMDAPKLSVINSEDFILLDHRDFSNEKLKMYQEANEVFNFFQTDLLRERKFHDTEFPSQ